MLVAFEAGGLLRALVLLLIYPFVCLVNEQMGLKMMVMVCFCGIKKETFRVGTAVLPKYFLEDVGFEGFEMLMRGGRKVGMSKLPKVMVEGFLKEYLGIDVVVGRELKVVNGYYVGLMEDKMIRKSASFLQEIFGEQTMDSDVIGIGSLCNPLDHLFSICKEIYMLSDADKKKWHYLPKEKYPKPLIFHDGRLAQRPTPLATLAIFIYLPFGIFLFIIRGLVALSLPYKISNPILAFSGLRLKITKPNSCVSTSNTTNVEHKSKGILYVCNHKTLLDPLYLSVTLNKPITAVTYSLSRISELLAPIKTVRLTRDRDQDAKMMDKLLSQGDLVLCPEGTTCREPYILRFSPLFAEMGDEIVPVAMDAHASMFYGTTASGFKCLDPLFFMMNPFPSYNVKLLEKVSGTSRCHDGDDGGELRLKIANSIQKEIGKALQFECTKLTRKDKYLILAGNDGIVKASNKS
ncbi:Glycerol-3-phosphate acyltransferase 3 protein [Thalictrum thalictroides]|uniref:Glycerol-3-phosphate acyltransferase 3 protein n=1 Tax=Thalictrum thalictroides TaxID=46969 RepID=A0A7J6X744_THATH|nr:Glycerol-3-phosphate acyltransferase 3 protein [Thalictrum thalictroides]